MRLLLGLLGKWQPSFLLVYAMRCDTGAVAAIFPSIGENPREQGTRTEEAKCVKIEGKHVAAMKMHHLDLLL